MKRIINFGDANFRHLAAAGGAFEARLDRDNRPAGGLHYVGRDRTGIDDYDGEK
jgi:hypothetical protein